MIWALILLPAVFAAEIVCPGGKHKCSDSATCCQLADKSYGCCPMPNAVCCSDHVHCCPQGSRCDVGMCVRLDSNSSLANNELRNVCPGSEFTCPEASTCCMDPEGEVYGCCLLPDAVCCSDLEHCCPKDTTCDTAHQRCVGKDFQLEMFDSRKKVGLPTKIPAKDTKAKDKPLKLKKSHSYVNDIICGGGSFRCPDEYTCCELPGGQWGCCPYSNATCCSDKKHCCPYGTECDPTFQMCIRGAQNVTWSKNIPAERFV